MFIYYFLLQVLSWFNFVSQSSFPPTKTSLRGPDVLCHILFNVLCSESVKQVPAWSPSGLDGRVDRTESNWRCIPDFILRHLFPPHPSLPLMVKRGIVRCRKPACLRLLVDLKKKKKLPCGAYVYTFPPFLPLGTEVNSILPYNGSFKRQP